MLVIDEKNKRKTNKYNCIRGIVYEDDNYIEYGYFKYNNKLPIRLINGRHEYDISEKGKTMKKLFSKDLGQYLIVGDTDKITEYKHNNIYGNGKYPYSIEREYEAEKHIKLFSNEVGQINNLTKFQFSDYLKYSFGIEFETAAGYIPEDKCFELGLIPLRDGSISGVEYSTIPLKGNEGLNLLKSQMECFKEYTLVNKECSIHIHLGGYPVNPRSILVLHTLWYYMQYVLDPFIPKWSYRTEKFKNSGKSYCKPVEHFTNFKELYKYYAQQNYLGSLYQPHPCDIDKRAKWNIKTRYFNCNFINMLCYNSAKTVEFRFLTPTYSFEKLTTFLMIFNALLMFAESMSKASESFSDFEIVDRINDLINTNQLNITMILKSVYPSDIINRINETLLKLECLNETQNNVGDYCGARLDIEHKYFSDGQ
jgi:hypothetical protein